MKSCKIFGNKPPSHVYLIFRVFGLDISEARNLPGWCIYLDPKTLEEQGILNFTAPKFTKFTVAPNQ